MSWECDAEVSDGITLERDPQRGVLDGIEIDEGIGAFTKYQEGSDSKTREVLREAVDKGESLVIALDGGKLIGYLTVALPPRNEPWGEIDRGSIVELGPIEVSRSYRGRKLGKRMIEYVFASGDYEDKIVITKEYSWHWDIPRGMSKDQYRELLMELKRSTGFKEFATDEPNIAYDYANSLTARIGEKVGDGLRTSFLCCLYKNSVGWGAEWCRD